MLPELRDLFVRDLEKLTLELEAYPDEASVWAVPDGVTNSGGTLALHLIGNLSQFVGADLGGVAFVRDRPAEFARRDVPRAELVAGVRGVSALVAGTLDRLDPTRLDAPHPTHLPGFPEGMSTRFFLIHTDSVYFANNPELHRIDGSTSGTRVAPTLRSSSTSRVRSDPAGFAAHSIGVRITCTGT